MLISHALQHGGHLLPSRLHSNSATGAVGVVFSLMAIIQAVGFFFGHGSGNTISRMLGAPPL